MSKRRDEGKKGGGKREGGGKEKEKERREGRKQKEKRRNERGERQAGRMGFGLMSPGTPSSPPRRADTSPQPALVCHQQRSSGASGSHKIVPVLLPALRRLSCLFSAKKWWDYQVKHVCHQAQWVECCSRQVHRKMLICPRLGVSRRTQDRLCLPRRSQRKGQRL